MTSVTACLWVDAGVGEFGGQTRELWIGGGDGLKPVYGMDESGHMDAMGLAWVAMMPNEDRPFILQKAGGLQGVFTYIAFAPAHGIAVFVAINKFDFGAAMAMGTAANELIANLAPR